MDNNLPPQMPESKTALSNSGQKHPVILIAILFAALVAIASLLLILNKGKLPSITQKPQVPKYNDLTFAGVGTGTIIYGKGTIEAIVTPTKVFTVKMESGRVVTATVEGKTVVVDRRGQSIQTTSSTSATTIHYLTFKDLENVKVGQHVSVDFLKDKLNANNEVSLSNLNLLD